MGTIKIQLIIGLMLVLLSSCTEKPDSPGLSDIYQVYFYEHNDTVLSADSHEFILSIDDKSSAIPQDWSVKGKRISQLVWYGDKMPNETDTFYYFPGNPFWRKPGPDYYETDNSVGVDWISFEKIPNEKSPKLKITVSKNDSGKYRIFKFSFGNDYETYSDLGYVTVLQKPMPDMEPFEMKIRYKGNTYSSNAHLNINEEIEYEDSEFSRVMNEIDALDNVECVIMEDETVDYFDLNDGKTAEPLTKLRSAIPAGRTVDIRMDMPATRASDAYRYSEPTALGYFAMYDDTGFTDTHEYKNLFSFYDIFDQHYMRDIGLNDKVSSLAVEYRGTDPEVCSVLTIWEDSNFNYGDNDRTKHRISIIATKENPRVSISNLKSVKCIGSGNSWNDRISSFSFAFGNYDSHLKDY